MVYLVYSVGSWMAEGCGESFGCFSNRRTIVGEVASNSAGATHHLSIGRYVTELDSVRSIHPVQTAHPASVKSEKSTTWACCCIVVGHLTVV